ncbi:MAG: VTT domain-containing protein [Saprospiraceae bacterium]|nr:VTT domain-containing protein [Saprospiraceae bacterium]MCB9322109.1 VTT domain-containing protein [Lewinellaceae bacterium]
MIKKAKIVIYSLWILLIIGALLTFALRPEVASPEYIVRLISRFSNEMLLAYIVVTIGRGFFLIPSTPFVIGGAILFPDNLFLVLVISMIGVLFSATALYYFSDLLGFSKYLEKKYPKGVERWKERLQHPRAALFVLGWAFFPFVPTDLICYVAGIVKMPYRFMFIGVFLGELTLNVFYVYFGGGIFEAIF